MTHTQKGRAPSPNRPGGWKAGRGRREVSAVARKRYVVSCAIQGVVSVVIEAESQKKALERLGFGDWDDSFDVQIEPTGKVDFQVLDGRDG